MRMREMFLIVGFFCFVSIIGGYQYWENDALKKENFEQRIMIADLTAPPIGGMEEAIREVLPVLLWPIISEDRVPIEMEITSYYGVRFSPFTSLLAIHKGLDLRGIRGARFQTPCEVKVIDRWYPPGGNYKGNGPLGGCYRLQSIEHPEYIFVYGHLSETYYREGTILEAGVVFARQGNTGLVSGSQGGHHLHVEILKNGENVNPLKYFDQEG